MCMCCIVSGLLVSEAPWVGLGVWLGFAQTPEGIFSLVFLYIREPIFILRDLQNSESLNLGRRWHWLQLEKNWEAGVLLKMLLYRSATGAVGFVWFSLKSVCMSLCFSLNTSLVITIKTQIHCSTSRSFFPCHFSICRNTMICCFDVCTEPSPILLGIILNWMKVMLL